MIKYIKNKVNNYINKLVDNKIESHVGKRHQKSENYYTLMDKAIYNIWNSSFSANEKEGSTGLFKRIEKLEEKVDALEKLLKIKYVHEEKKFSGYKKTNKK